MHSPLILTTSPRPNGNSDDAAQMLSKELNNHPVTTLRNFNIQHCIGCLDCENSATCGIQDDFNKVWQTFRTAKTVVLIIPVYWCAPPGLCKDFIDRTVAFFDEEPLKGKTVHLVSIAQSAGFELQEKMIEKWVVWLGGSKLRSKTRIIAFHQGELLKNKSAIRKLKQLASSLQA